jgi:tellurite methyltransferase
MDSPLVMEIAGKLPPARALDLACGTGRDALWLAHQGWQVTAVDSSPPAIATLQDLARGLSVETVLADLEKHEFTIQPAAWDLILMSLYLQRDLFPSAQRGLRKGGVLIAIVLLEEEGEPRPFRVRPGELAGYFTGWEILHSFEGRRNTHAVAEIAARLLSEM